MKRLNLIGICLLAYAGIQAAPLTPGQALERLNDGRQSSVSATRLEKSPAWTARTSNGTATVYVFNESDGNGYRILAADDAAYAVLGYSDTGRIDPENMSPELKWWLEYTGAQMEYYISRGATRGEAAPKYAPMAPIEPLVKSKWNQDAPYNNDCPRLNNKQTYTGCVATSMAQLMYYHKYPEKGTGSASYYWGAGGRTLNMDFSAKAFDWDNMLHQYSYGDYNAEQAEAVAYLMKSCGYSVGMSYGTDASGAAGPSIAYALRQYFDYDPNVNVKWRVTYSASEWASEVYRNLNECGPVILNGHQYNDAGHSFVCDGYNGDGYFHFNWGWGGVSDGWYLLECMNPESQGIGGAAMGLAYNYGLNGIFGIQRPTGEPAQPMYGNLLMSGACTAEFIGNQIIFTRTSWYPDGWYCASDRSITVNMGIIIEPVDGTPGETMTQGGTFNGSVRVTSNPSQYFPTTAGPSANFPTGLPDGRYKVTIGIRDLSISGSPYIPVLCPYGAANYVYVTIKDGEKTIENVPTPSLQPENLTLETQLYCTRYALFKVKVKNPSDFELTENIAPALLKGNRIVMVGAVAPLTCAPNTDSEIEWEARMSPVEGEKWPTTATEYTLAIVDPVTGKVIGTYGTVTMNMNPGKATLRANSLTIKDCTTTTETTESGAEIQVYNVKDSRNFTVDLDYYVWAGFFDGVVTGSINKTSLANVNSYELVTNIYNGRQFMEEEESRALSLPVDFADAEPDALYTLQFSYTSGSDVRQLRSVYFRTGQSGVTDVNADSGESVRYYNLQGMEIAKPVKGQIVIVKKGDSTFKIRF